MWDDTLVVLGGHSGRFKQVVNGAFPLFHAAGMSGLLLLTSLMPGMRLIEAGALTTLVLVAVTAR